MMRILASPFMAEGEAPCNLDQYGFHSKADGLGEEPEEEEQEEFNIDT